MKKTQQAGNQNDACLGWLFRASRLVKGDLILQFADPLQSPILGNPGLAKAWIFGSGQRQGATSERSKSGDSSKCAKAQAQLLVDAKSWRRRLIGGLNLGFAKKKAPCQFA